MAKRKTGTKKSKTIKSEPGRPARQVAADWVEENGYRVAAAAAVPVPIPGAHTALCTALEAYMISNIAKIYGRSLTIGECIALVPTLGGAVVVGKTVSSVVGEVVGWIPFAGWAVKGAVGGATAYGIGKAAVHWFEGKQPDQEAAPFETVSLRDFVKDAMAELGFGKAEAKKAAESVAKADQEDEEEDE